MERMCKSWKKACSIFINLSGSTCLKQLVFNWCINLEWRYCRMGQSRGTDGEGKSVLQFDHTANNANARGDCDVRVRVWRIFRGRSKVKNRLMHDSQVNWQKIISQWRRPSAWKDYIDYYRQHENNLDGGNWKRQRLEFINNVGEWYWNWKCDSQSHATP